MSLNGFHEADEIVSDCFPAFSKQISSKPCDTVLWSDENSITEKEIEEFIYFDILHLSLVCER